MIDHQRKLLFVHISRTGGTSVETALVGKDWWLTEPSTKHISAKQARKFYGEEIWRSYTKFSIVRNPWDRVISMWATGRWHEHSNLHESCSLKVFIKNLKPHPNEPCNSLFYCEILNDDLDHILRFENLQNDLNHMLDCLGLKKEPLPHINKRQRRPYTDMYNENDKALVQKLFSQDIKYFHYQFPVK